MVKQPAPTGLCGHDLWHGLNWHPISAYILIICVLFVHYLPTKSVSLCFFRHYPANLPFYEAETRSFL